MVNYILTGVIPEHLACNSVVQRREAGGRGKAEDSGESLKKANEAEQGSEEEASGQVIWCGHETRPYGAKWDLCK